MTGYTLKSLALMASVVWLQACAPEKTPATHDNPVAPSETAAYSLTTKHTSVFNKISYRIPSGWVVIDGESDWIAPSQDKFHGQPTFDPGADSEYVVSVIFPHLTMEDMSGKTVRAFEDLVNSTSHSLKIAAGAQEQSSPVFGSVNGHDAASLDVVLGTGRAFHQTFLKLSDTQIASVAGIGPQTESTEIKALVNAIANTVEAPNKK